MYPYQRNNHNLKWVDLEITIGGSLVISPAQDKWKKILKIDIMSNKESDSDPNNDVMIVKILE